MNQNPRKTRTWELPTGQDLERKRRASGASGKEDVRVSGGQVTGSAPDGMNPEEEVMKITRRVLNHMWVLAGIALLALVVRANAFDPQNPAAGGIGFVENRGQLNDAAHYYAIGSRASVFFTPQALVFDLSAPVEPPAPAGSDGPQPATAPGLGCAIWMRFENANPAPVIEAREMLPGYHNFLVGNDPSAWRCEVPAFAEVVYRDVWPGIDLVFREEGGAIHYRVEAGPSADASRVAFAYVGADAVVADENGAYRIETALGALIDSRPGVYDNEGTVSYVGSGDDATSAWEPGDGGRAIGFSTYLGSGGSENGKAVAYCRDGTYIVTGETNTAAFPTTTGAYDRSDNGGADIFVTKINSAGSALVWSTLLGGNGNDYAWGIVIDGNKFPTVVGSTSSTNFPMAPPYSYDTSYNGGASDGFAARLNATGSALLSSTYLGGNARDECRGVGIDYYGITTIVGFTESPNFPLYLPIDGIRNGPSDGFVLRLNSGTLLYSTLHGGISSDVCYDVDLDGLNPVVTGQTSSPDFPTTSGACDRTLGGASDAFVTRFLLLGTSNLTICWSSYLGGSNSECGWAIDLEFHNPVTAVVAGWTMSTNFPVTTGAYDVTANGGTDGFITRFNSAGSGLSWSTYLGGAYNDACRDLVMDPAGNANVVGDTYSATFPTTSGAYDRTYNGGQDAFVSRVNAAGTILLTSTFLGTSATDLAWGVASEYPDKIILTGTTFGSTFPTTSGAFDRTYNGLSDAFVTKFSGTFFTQDQSPEVTQFSSGRTMLLAPNSPNPFSSSTSIRFSLPEAGDVSVTIHDVSGRLMCTLAKGAMNPGDHVLAWDGRDDRGGVVSSGVYFCKVQTPNLQDARRVIFMKQDR